MSAAVVTFVLYLLGVVAIGAWATRFSSAGVSEFFLGGRRMNRVVVALSAVVSGRSAWLLTGVTGMAYTRGASAIWAVVGYVIVELFLFLYYAKRLRIAAETYDAVTVPDFFAGRFGEQAGPLRMVSALVIFLFMVSYVAAQLTAGGKAFAAGFGLDPTAGIWLTAGIVLLYTVLGGFLAVSLTDVLQAGLMLFALVGLPVWAVAEAGGLGAVLAELDGVDAALVDPLALSAGAFLGFVGIGLGSPGSPHVLARYMSIDDPEQLRVSAVVGTVWNVLMGWGAVFIGLAGRTLFPLVDALPQADPENLYPALAAELLPPALFGLVIAAVFAAIMSTADSQLLVAASAVVRDFYQQGIRGGAPVPERRLVFLSRTTVVVLVGLSLLLGFYADELVFWLVLFAWAGLGAAFGPTTLLALYWRRTTRAGVLAGIVTGTVVTFAWQSVPALDTRLYELIPAFTLSLAATWLVSLLTSPGQAEPDTP